MRSRAPAGGLSAAANPAPLVAAVAAIVATMGGLAATTPFAVPGVAAFAALGVAAGLLARFGPGVLIAGLLFGVMDALPGPSLQYRDFGGGLTVQDALILCLLGTLLALNWREHFSTLRCNAHARWVAIASCVLLMWWLVALLRSVVLAAVPLVEAANFGKDFLFFAAAMILAPGALANSRVRDTFICAVAVWIVPVSLAEIATSAGLWDGIGLVHPLQDLETFHGRRLYSTVSDLVAFAGLFALGAVLLSTNASQRRCAVIVASCCLVDVAFSLTRAKYIGVPVGASVAIGAALLAGGAVRRSIGRAAIVAGALFVVVTLTVGSTFSASGPAVSRVAERVQSAAGELQGSNATGGNTVAYRSQLADKMLDILGARWPEGLGLLDPRTYYFGALPRGSIRNSDVGALNVLMTLGLVGLGLVYAPLVMTWWWSCRLMGNRALRDPERWQAFGVVASLTLSIVTSLSLVILFTPGGAVLTALCVGVGLSLRLAKA